MNVAVRLISNNYTKTRSGSKIQEITIHHTAGNIKLANMYTMFNTAANAVSSHYGVKDTEVMQYVDEANTAWTNSNWAANCRAVTIEVSNSGGAPDWNVSYESLESLIDLVYDIASRNNLLPLVKGVSLTWHSLYSATACPGAFLLSKIDTIITQVNAMYTADGNDFTTQAETAVYRVRETWEDSTTQKGAFNILENAQKFCDSLNQNTRYTVYDETGNVVYPE